VYRPDFEPFREELDRCAVMFNREKPDDVLCQMYWKALQDLPLPVVRERIALHLRHGKFFPKPSELRPKEDKPKERDKAGEAAFKNAERLSLENLAELRAKDPGAWAEEVSMRKLDRIIATTDPSSAVYAQALKEWHALKAGRLEKWKREWYSCSGAASK